MTSRTIFITLTIMLIFQTGYAQTLAWAKQFGGTSLANGHSIITDASGNVYTTGTFKGTVDFDPGPSTSNLTSPSGSDVFTSKLDIAGNFIWAKRIGGTGFNIGYSIAVDNSGNVFTTGCFQGTADFDPGPNTFNMSASTNSDAFVSKLDASGNFVWAKQFIGANSTDEVSIALDASGNIYTTGTFDGTADFNPGTNTFNLTSAGLTDVFISKLDPSGNFIWAKQLGGTAFHYSYSIALDGSGNVYTTGMFAGTADFDPGASTFNLTAPGTSVGNQDVFISKLDASGNFIWAKQFGGYGGYSINVDPFGNVFTTGHFYGTEDFNPGSGTFNLTSSGNSDVFISKLDASGNFIWAKKIGGSSAIRGNCITTDANGNVFTTGYFQGTADFDPNTGNFNLTSAGTQDIFISKLDASGNFRWANKLGGVGNDRGFCITVDISDNVFTTGMFRGTADFDPSTSSLNLTSYSAEDAFVHKMSQTAVGIIENTFSSQITIYPNPTNDQLTIESKNELQNLILIIRNLMGQEVLRKNYPFINRIEMTLDGDKGIYFIELIEGNKKAILKVIKD